jgi:hypothetical protein
LRLRICLLRSSSIFNPKDLSVIYSGTVGIVRLYTSAISRRSISLKASISSSGIDSSEFEGFEACIAV